MPKSCLFFPAESGIHKDVLTPAYTFITKRPLGEKGRFLQAPEFFPIHNILRQLFGEVCGGGGGGGGGGGRQK